MFRLTAADLRMCPALLRIFSGEPSGNVEGRTRGKLEEKLSPTGNPATLEQVKVVGERNQGDRHFRLEMLPALPAYAVRDPS